MIYVLNFDYGFCTIAAFFYFFIPWPGLLITLQSAQNGWSRLAQWTLCDVNRTLRMFSLTLYRKGAAKQWLLSNCGHFLDWTLIMASVCNAGRADAGPFNTLMSVPVNYSFVRHAILVLMRGLPGWRTVELDDACTHKSAKTHACIVLK